MSTLFSHWGVIPPYEGEVGAPAAFSPYPWTTAKLVRQLGHTPERRELLRNLFEYRRRLRSFGIQGIQWVDGSFVEDCERLRKKAPSDIDLMNLVIEPSQDLHGTDGWRLLFDRAYIKGIFNLDVMQPIPIGFDEYDRPMVGLQGLTYYFSLFSHSRPVPFGIPVWKGMIEIVLRTDDEDTEAISLLAQGGQQ